MARIRKRNTKELDATLIQVTKRYGTNTVSKANKIIQPDRISTGSFVLDFCLLGGVPHNRSSMIVGERHAGKSMLACKIIANAQRQYPNGRVVFLDIEGTFDSTWAEKLGVNVNALDMVFCETGEMAVDVADAVAGSLETSLVLLDSLAVLAPTKEIESSVEDQHIGLQARLITSMTRRLTSTLVKERRRNHFITVVYLNQFRAKIGGYGDPRSIPGGRALEAANSVQIIIKNKEVKGTSDMGIESMSYNEHPFTITKNKLNSGPRSGEFRLLREGSDNKYLSEGDIDNPPSLLAFAKKFGLYTGSGREKKKLEFLDYSYSFNSIQEVLDMLYQDEEICNNLWVFLLQLQAARLGMPEEFIERLGYM